MPGQLSEKNHDNGLEEHRLEKDKGGLSIQSLNDSRTGWEVVGLEFGPNLSGSQEHFEEFR